MAGRLIRGIDGIRGSEGSALALDDEEDDMHGIVAGGW